MDKFIKCNLKENNIETTYSNNITCTDILNAAKQLQEDMFYTYIQTEVMDCLDNSKNQSIQDINFIKEELISNINETYNKIIDYLNQYYDKV